MEHPKATVGPSQSIPWAGTLEPYDHHPSEKDDWVSTVDRNTIDKFDSLNENISTYFDGCKREIIGIRPCESGKTGVEQQMMLISTVKEVLMEMETTVQYSENESKPCNLAFHQPWPPVIHNGEVERPYPRLCPQKWHSHVMITTACKLKISKWLTQDDTYISKNSTCIPEHGNPGWSETNDTL